MNELALFIGGGGGALGSQLIGHRIVCGVEIDPYCREVIMRRQEEGFLPAFPIWDDIKTFDGRPWRGFVDIVTAGFPCQPFSLAGKRKGAADKRNCWPDTFRVIQEVRPRYVLLENVPGIRRYLPVVIRDLRRAEYAVKRPLIVAAASLGAGHIRKRIWTFAYDKSECKRTGLRSIESVPKWRGRSDNSIASKISADINSLRQREQSGRRARTDWTDSSGNTYAYQTDLFTDLQREGPQGHAGDSSNGDQSRRDRKKQIRPITKSNLCFGKCTYWDAEPGLARLVRRPANRVERIRITGNIQVPAVVRLAWKILTDALSTTRLQ